MVAAGVRKMTMTTTNLANFYQIFCDVLIHVDEVSWLTRFATIMKDLKT